MSADDFAQVAKAFPGVDSLVGSAPKSGELSAQIGGLSPALGAKSDLTGGMATVAERFGKLGLDGGMVEKYVKIILDFAQSEAGSTVTDIIKKGLV